MDGLFGHPLVRLIIAVLAIMVMIVLIKAAVNKLPDGSLTTPAKDIVNAV